MKKGLIGLLTVVALLFLAIFFANRYFNSGSIEPDNSVWFDYIGRDTTVGLWPDIYANYFAYTFVRTNNNLALKIQGEFPNTRYMSFNVYNLQDKSTQGSIVDAQIKAAQPFVVDSKKRDDRFTIHILPEKYANSKLPNKLTFLDEGKFLLVVMRLYDFNQDNYGGVSLPTVQAFELGEKDKLKSLPLPRALNLRKYVNAPKIAEDIWFMYESENLKALDGPHQRVPYFTLPFFRVIGEGMIQNNDNLYLLSAVTKKKNELYILKFKSPTFVKTTEDIGNTDVRYWSVNIGDDISYDFNALKDEDCLIDEQGFVTIVIGEGDADLKGRVAALGFNFMEWNVPRNKGFIIYRNMLTKEGFAGHFLQVPPLKEKNKNAFLEFEAGQYIGEYAPKGIRMSKEAFLKEYIQ